MTAPAPAPAPACPACQAPLSPGARYCHRCGRALVQRPGERTAWIVAWALVALSIAVIVYYVTARSADPSRPDMANVGSAAGGAGTSPGSPPDISAMSPRERFLRLNDRIVSALDAGDSATATRFTPMALSAYGMLETLDADLRYHAGVLQLRAGNPAGALALADTIQAPPARHHLMGYLLRAEVAQQGGDQAGLDRAARAFLQNYDQELALRRPEYIEHAQLLEGFRAQAEGRYGQ